MNSISLQLINQNDPVEFEKFRRLEFENLLTFYREYVKNVNHLMPMMNEVFNLIYLKQEKQFKNYNELKECLSLTANEQVLQYNKIGNMPHE